MAGDGGPTLANEVFVTGWGECEKRLDTGLGPTGVTEGFHELIPPLKAQVVAYVFFYIL